ncbi:hypothetical protein F5887DRAFT_951379 [Amanita rubescens]|nr:hypothetical protein F5887DRAFT_951379 [Amanita rubescens]
MILVNVVHNDSATYTLLGRQCYWFADTIFGLLEKWAKIYNNNATTTDEKEKLKRGKHQFLTGNIGVVPVHRRDPIHINKIWDVFTGERQTMGKQREVFEQARTEEIRMTKELAGQVTKLKKEREERERRHQEEQRLLRQQIADQQRQLEEQHRQWQLRPQQNEETERRFQQMEQRIITMSSSQIHLNLAPSS